MIAILSLVLCACVCAVPVKMSDRVVPEAESLMGAKVGVLGAGVDRVDGINPNQPEPSPSYTPFDRYSPGVPPLLPQASPNPVVELTEENLAIAENDISLIIARGSPPPPPASPSTYATPAPPAPKFNAAPCAPANPHMASPIDGYAAAYQGTCNDQVQEFLVPGTLASYSQNHHVVLFIGAGTQGIKMTNQPPYPYLQLERNIDQALHDIDQKFGGKQHWVAVFGGDPVSGGGIGNVMFYIRNKGYRVVAFQSWEGLKYNAPENANCAAVEATAVDYTDAQCREEKVGGVTQDQVFYKRSEHSMCVRDESRHEDNDSENLIGATSHYLDKHFKLAAAVKIGGGEIAQQEEALLKNRKGLMIYVINVDCNPGKWTGYNPNKGEYAPQGNSDQCASVVVPQMPMTLVPAPMPIAQQIVPVAQAQNPFTVTQSSGAEQP